MYLAVIILVLSHMAVELDLRGLVLFQDSRLDFRFAETYINDDIMSRELPWIEVQPIVRDLDLISIYDFLLENTITVSQSVAPRRVVQRGQTVEETSRKTAQTSITKRSVVLLLDNILDTEAKVRKSL